MHTVGLPRTCLGFTNVLFFLFGTVGFVICIWCMVNTEFFREVNYTVTRSSLVGVIADFVNLKLWLTPLTSVLAPLAVIAMMTSCCGILGAGCKMKCAVKSYIFLVTVLSLISCWMFFVSGIYNIYTKNEKTQNFMRSSIQKDYGKKDDLVTYLWDHVMVNYECCGAVNYHDFIDSNWQKVNRDKFYPIQCCEMTKVNNSLVSVSENCTSLADMSVRSYKDVGCFYALRKAIINHKGKLITYFILVAIFYLTVILFAYCLIRDAPLLGSMAGQFTNLAPGKAPKDEPKEVTSDSSLQNMMFVEEPPKRVVKVVSAMNPFQTYKFQPSVGSGDLPHHRSHM